jgi:hypothetical protein
MTAGCARGVRPDDQSAEAHRAEAQKEQAEAEAHRREFDPNQTHTRVAAGHGRADAPVDVEYASYNPTEWHLHEADRLSAHARAHEKAAAELEKFEMEECHAFTPKVRAACPVGGPVTRVDDLPDGVRFVLADNAPIDAVVAHMKCHFAWARTRGFADLPGCPVYIKGIEIRLSADGKSVEVTARDRAVAAELKRRSHEEGHSNPT